MCQHVSGQALRALHFDSNERPRSLHFYVKIISLSNDDLKPLNLAYVLCVSFNLDSVLVGLFT